MKKREIKKRIMRFDELSVPTAEEILPTEALTVTKKSKWLPRFAIAALAVSIIAVTGVVIASVAKPDAEKTKLHPNTVLNNDPQSAEASDTTDDEQTLEDSKVVEESQDPIKSLPIVSCGKYAGPTVDTSGLEGVVPAGEVRIGSLGRYVPVDRDDVLYPVCFEAHCMETEAYKEGIRLIQEEGQEKRNALIDKAIDYLKENEKEVYEEILEAYRGRLEFFQTEGSVDDFHEYVIFYLTALKYPYYQEDNPAWLAPITDEVSKTWHEYEDKLCEFGIALHKEASTKLHESLEKGGVKFYDKTAYYCEYTPEGEIKEIMSEKTYRVAFLTKAQIDALEATEGYGILVNVVFEELAKPDNEDIFLDYLSFCFLR